MHLCLVNPDNPVVSISKVRWNRLNRYRVWKPLSLYVIAGLTPPEWEVSIVDENLGGHVETGERPPDLVGITAFTSQATRAYAIAAAYRNRGVPVVMGGIHASMLPEEALEHVDAVVTGEAEGVWADVLRDATLGRLQRVYAGGRGPAEGIAAARHDLDANQYPLGMIQTTRGCPLACRFCSVTSFNGGAFRHRPIPQVIAELRTVPENRLLFVDDNLIGTRADHIAYAKDLFRSMIAEGFTRPWFCQATINFGGDEELLDLAARSGCAGVFIGFESPTKEGLVGVHKQFNIKHGGDFRTRVRRIQARGILVVGSFIMGLDTDTPGVGERIAEAARDYNVDMASVFLLTPLPGTELYASVKREGRIVANSYPGDWQYYTLDHPVMRYSRFTAGELLREKHLFYRSFYGFGGIARRVAAVATRRRGPARAFLALIGNLAYRRNHAVDARIGALERMLGKTTTETLPPRTVPMFRPKRT